MAIELSDGVDHHSPETRQDNEIAIHDMLEGNLFRPKGSPGGPYRLVLKIAETVWFWRSNFLIPWRTDASRCR